MATVFGVHALRRELALDEIASARGHVFHFSGMASAQRCAIRDQRRVACLGKLDVDSAATTSVWLMASVATTGAGARPRAARKKAFGRFRGEKQTDRKRARIANVADGPRIARSSSSRPAPGLHLARRFSRASRIGPSPIQTKRRREIRVRWRRRPGEFL
jgi:hypothetical protein